MHLAAREPLETPRQSLITIRRDGDVVIARPAGPKITQREAPMMLEAIVTELDAVGRSLHALILDFTEVELVASMGLGMCIDARNRAAAVGAKTVVFGLNDELVALFRMMKIHRLCPLVADEAALRRILRR